MSSFDLPVADPVLSLTGRVRDTTGQSQVIVLKELKLPWAVRGSEVKVGGHIRCAHVWLGWVVHAYKACEGIG